MELVMCQDYFIQLSNFIWYVRQGPENASTMALGGLANDHAGALLRAARRRAVVAPFSAAAW
jgi:hypothetical protein